MTTKPMNKKIVLYCQKIIWLHDLRPETVLEIIYTIFSNKKYVLYWKSENIRGIRQ